MKPVRERSLPAAAPAAPQDADTVEGGVGFRLVLLVNYLSRPFFAKYGQQFDLGINEWRIIMTLRSHPGVSASDVSALSGLHKMNVSRGVQRLLRQERILARPDAADGRRKLLYLREEGQAVFDAIWPDAHRSEEQLVSALTPAECRAFGLLLDKLVLGVRNGSVEA